ncbi:VgrG protein [Minicystis rosea]|nr:VgrG protein [Minicystis rosea]
MADLITISSSVLPDAARVVGFRGFEAISRPYEIEIFISLQQELGDELDLADGIGAKAALSIDRQVIGEKPFVFAGILANLELLHAFDGRILLRATLVPRLWQLGLSRHSRIFTKMKVPDIIKSVLEENGVSDVDMRLGSYETEEHVSQYRESDLDFISRWMEREGIFYFFEHTDEGERLVLCDQKRYDEDELGRPVRYFPQLGHDHSAGQSLRMFTCRHTTLPSSVRLKDYDYAKPSLNVSGTARVADNGAGEVSLYGERFFTPAAGDKLARTRAEEMLARQVVYRATGTRHHLRPGYMFELEEHPLPSFNASYLTIEARHTGNQSAGLAHFRELTGIESEEVYQVEIEAVPAKAQFRAESRTAWPRIYGFENGVVDGPADSEYAQLDDQGRYLCKFKYDESKLKSGKATTYVRMMQPHGGDIEGFHFPLRKGTEVVFSFLGGDCDRPVISGVVPNAVNPSPVTSSNHTRNVIQTGARNRLELEDKGGSEWIKLSTPYSDTFLRMGSPDSGHELILNTEKNTLAEIGNHWDVNVGQKGGGNWTTLVKGGNTSLHIPDGNYRIGVVGGVGINAQNGVHMLINGGAAVPAAGGDGGFKVEVKDNGIDMTAKTAVNVTSETDNIVMHAAKKVEIIADEDHKLTIMGKTFEIKTEDSNEIMLADEMKFTVGDSFGATVGDKKEFFFGTQFGLTAGTKSEIFVGSSSELKLSDATGVTIGSTSETYIGTKTEIEVAGKTGITIGASFEAKLAAELEISVALKAALELALALELTFGLKFVNSPTEVKINGIGLDTKTNELAMKMNDMKIGSLSLEVEALKAVV